MKKLLFLLAVFAGLWQTYAQKELQPYKYIEDKDSINKSFFIYAVANAPNSIKFTMKDDMGEVFKVNSDSLFNKKLKGENLEFTVFPFSEIEFKAKLIVAVTEINNTLKDKFDTETIKSAADNIFQFFNALVTTAFEYDNEPVAGKLVYNMYKITVTKNILQGTIDTKHYFDRQAIKLRDYLYEGNYVLENNNFLEWIVDAKDSLHKEFIEYKEILDYGSIRNLGKGRNKMKKYAKERLPEIYNKFYFSGDQNTPLHKLIKKYKELNDNEILKEDLWNKLAKDTSKYGKEIRDIENPINTKKEKLNKERDNLIYERNIYQKKVDSLQSILNITADSPEDAKSSVTNIKSEFEKKLELKKEHIKIKDAEISMLKEYSEKIEPSISVLEKKIKNEEKELISLNQDLDSLNQKISSLIYENKQLLLNLPLWKFKIEGIEIDINDGYFEHITMTGKLLSPDLNDVRKSENIIDKLYNEEATKEIISGAMGKSLKFENEFPIGFSSKADYADMYDYKLYHFEGGDKIFSMALSADLLTYIPHHQNDRLNFSPKDQVVTLPTQNEAESGAIELKKQESAKILHARFYTDFIGFKENEENSPAQIEIGKQVPIWTKRYNLGVGRSSNFGLIDYMDFNLTWAKLTEEDAELEVSKAPYYINGEEKFDDYVTYLDIISHENLSVGVDLNVFSIDFPLIKTRFDFNAGAHYGRVNVVTKTDVTEESEEEQQEVRVVTSNNHTNIIRYYPEIKTWIRPDERFGGNINWRPFKLVVPKTDSFRAVSSENLFLEERITKKNWLQRFELSTFFTPAPNSDNRFFFRYRYTNSLNFEYNGYSEVQVGYLYYLKF